MCSSFGQHVGWAKSPAARRGATPAGGSARGAVRRKDCAPHRGPVWRASSRVETADPRVCPPKRAQVQIVDDLADQVVETVHQLSLRSLYRPPPQAISGRAGRTDEWSRWSRRRTRPVPHAAGQAKGRSPPRGWRIAQVADQVVVKKRAPAPGPMPLPRRGSGCVPVPAVPDWPRGRR